MARNETGSKDPAGPGWKAYYFGVYGGDRLTFSLVYEICKSVVLKVVI